MELTIQSSLCKGLRACGIPKEQTHQILNEVSKWVDSSGTEWANARIKDLRQWYETCLTGKPVPPDWFKHSKDGYPCGIWRWVFDQKPAKALGVLSCNTVFYEDSLSDSQKEKFLKGVGGNQSYAEWDEFVMTYAREWFCTELRNEIPTTRMKTMPAIQFPTIFDMNGSIPVQDGTKSVRPNQQLGKALRALQESWKSCPQVTVDFLDEMDLLGYLPESVVIDNNGLISSLSHQDRRVGRVSIIQQPQLKARTVGNPNRVLQKTLVPLQHVYMDMAQKLPTDCTHDQESGVRWVQSQLKQGNELAGSDLTSASDLLEIERCLFLVDSFFGFRRIRGYEDYRDYFLEVSRSPWWCPELNCEVKWEQGSVLGTGPSFGLLTLTNNVCGLIAYNDYLLNLSQTDYYRELALRSYDDWFRVIGDDIIMRSELLPYYNNVIKDLGGEINFSKTLVSDRVAEFAGRIVTADSCYLKAIKYCEPSDNSFLSYVAQLGDQAKFFLKPKQRRVYDVLRFIPGVAVDGPWMPDSYGESLSSRYLWYLQEVEPVLKTAEPDLRLEDYEMSLLKAHLNLLAEGETDVEGYDTPIMSDEGYLPSQVTPLFKNDGDPRLTNGKTTLQVLLDKIGNGRIIPYEKWKELNHQTSSNGQFGVEDSRDHGSGVSPSKSLRR